MGREEESLIEVQVSGELTGKEEYEMMMRELQVPDWEIMPKRYDESTGEFELVAKVKRNGLAMFSAQLDFVRGRIAPTSYITKFVPVPAQ